ncbi:DctP family TRAP transporter solute-binding subunit [Aureimonas glaciei]|jgi:tripartite ATP-independent transporter DctP family solute receptor|nr:DctP family TRAP transporter solute-binding subunit [Aureimonas glaciei]
MKHFSKNKALVVTLAFLMGTGAAAAQTTMKIANVAPASHPSGIVLQEIADALNARDDINLDVQVFNDGVLGSEMETLDQINSGVLEGQVAQGISIFQPYSPQFGVEELPFLFPTREAAYAAVDGEFGQLIAAKAEEHGFKILAFWENGFRHFTNSKRAIVVPSDMSGLRFRTAESQIRLAMFASLGASAVALPFTELYAALQQGVVDGQENPLALISKASLANVQKYLSTSGHIWNAAPIVVSKVWWDGLDQPTQSAVQTAFDEAKMRERQLIAQGDEQLVEELKAAGMEVNEVDKQAFQTATETVWARSEETIGADLMALARQIRGGKTQ